MPIQVDHSRPVRTVDVKGRVLSTDTREAAPVKPVDSIGRDIKADAASAAQQAAAANPSIASEKPKEASGEPAGEEGKPTDADIRKAYLDAQKARRKAQDMEKKARDGLTRAEAFEKARAMAESGEDPTAILKAAGIDTVKYYQDLTKYALSDKAKEVEDPVKKELREQREKIDKYAKDVEEQAKRLQEKEDLQVHNSVIAQKVIPLFRDNPDKYEMLLGHYGENAPVEVYKTVWDIFQETGKARSFHEVADEMEAYWEENAGKGLEVLAKMKKFQNRFTQNGSGPSQHQDQAETPKRSVTLSNKPSVPAVSPSSPPAPPRRGLTRDERVAEILKRFSD